jgi:Na+/proline symporter
VRWSSLIHGGHGDVDEIPLPFPLYPQYRSVRPIVFGLSALDLVIVLLYLALMAFIGIWSHRKIHSMADFFMGNRTFGKMMMIAQTFGSGTHTAQPISVAGASYTEGISGIWYQWMWIFSTPVYWLLAPVYRRLRYVTIADFFRERYGRGMALLYVAIGLLYFCMNIGLVLKSAGTAVAGLTDGAISPFMSILIITVLFLLYGIIGGLHAVVITDVIQGILTLALSFMILPFALFKAGGLASLHAGLPAHMFDLVASGEMNLFFIVMIVVNGLVGIVVHPHHMAMNGTGKTELACRMGWTFGTFLKRFATIGWAFVGLFAAFLFPGLEYTDREMAFGIAAKNLLPAGLIGVMLTALLSAGMSTCDGFMVHAAALLTNNVYTEYINPQALADKKLLVGRLFSAVVVLGGIYFAFAFTSVIQGLLALLKVCSFLGLGFWAGILWPRANRYGAFGSTVIMASVALYTDHILGWPLPQQIALYLALGIVSIIIISKSTPPEPAGQLKKFFTLLDTPVGEEHLLRQAGVDIMLEGVSEASATSGPGWKNRVGALFGQNGGRGLLIVELGRLRHRFSWSRYRADIYGFLASSLAVLILIFLLLFIANWGR